MRVRVLQSTTAYWNYEVRTFAEGDELEGDIARHLADNAPDGAVDVLETDSGPEPGPDPEEAPEGPDGPPEELDIEATAADVLIWVGDDPERAGEALEAEQAKDKPRSTLVKQLEKLAAVDPEA